jgi:hypothetical protein
MPSRPHGTDCCININYTNPDLAAGYAGGCFYVISEVVDQAGLSIPPPSIVLLGFVECVLLAMARACRRAISTLALDAEYVGFLQGSG